MERAMKRLLLTTAILSLLAAPAFAGEHDDDNGEIDEIIENGETMNDTAEDHDDEVADDDDGDEDDDNAEEEEEEEILEEDGDEDDG